MPDAADGSAPSPDPRFSAAVVRAAYDAVADEYTNAFADDLERLPVEMARRSSYGTVDVERSVGIYSSIR